MAQYANQKTYIIHRINPVNKGNVYLTITASALANASKILTPTGFKLYLYLATNKDGYSLDFSPKHFSDLYGVSYDSARKAPADLMNNHFLVPNKDGKYDFYEEPQVAVQFAFQPQCRLVPLMNGELFPISLQEFLNQVVSDTITAEEATEYWKNCEVANNE